MPMAVHMPVLVEEALHWLAPAAGQRLVDGTFGGGGHARRLAEAVLPGGHVLGLDRDPQAIAAGRSATRGLPIELVQASFADLPQVLAERAEGPVDGILLDLGLSSDQLADESRGFSFGSSGPLDLRFDPAAGEPAWRLLERATAAQIADWLFRYGEERYSRRIARAIVERRRTAPLRTAAELADLVRRTVPRGRGPQRIDPATRTFQGLRIAVNQELTELERALQLLPECLRPGGRLAVISFHSLEDRLVKEALRSDPRWTPLVKKPLRPSGGEVAANPRARSARLRVAARSATGTAPA
jgi:16S rRNA (cytosine1402-N4)-methyltransferase